MNHLLLYYRTDYSRTLKEWYTFKRELALKNWAYQHTSYEMNSTVSLSELSTPPDWWPASGKNFAFNSRLLQWSCFSLESTCEILKYILRVFVKSICSFVYFFEIESNDLIILLIWGCCSAWAKGCDCNAKVVTSIPTRGKNN